MSKDSILSKINKINDKGLEEIKLANNLETIENLRIKYLGRKSEFTQILRSLKDLNPEDKKEVGKLSNEVKQRIENEITRKKDTLTSQELEEKIKTEWIDVTYPPNKLNIGKKHPISQMQEYAENIFQKMGFEIIYPDYEIDNEYNAFTAVNIPENHPARDMWDTFWTENDLLAIPHTSAMQNRILKSQEPPIRAIIPGKCFRNEATDARHEHTFYQLEGIYVDKGISLNHMIGTLKEFFHIFFEQEVNVMFTPDFFPFVEPGGMMSIDCSNLKGDFDIVSKGTGWLEVLGCGMIHPKVLEMGGIDPNVYSGFAWGVGLERLIMLKYEIDDIRLFHSGNLNFINQF